MTTLSESIEWILDAIVVAVQAAVDDDNDALSDEGVESVVRGDRARPMPKLPSVWIVPQMAQFTQGQYGDEDWMLPVSIAGLVKSDEPEDGGKKAAHLAALGRGAVLARAHALMQALGVEVVDVTSWTFDPAARSSERNRTLFWTDAVVRVTFTVSG